MRGIIAPGNVVKVCQSIVLARTCNIAISRDRLVIHGFNGHVCKDETMLVISSFDDVHNDNVILYCLTGKGSFGYTRAGAWSLDEKVLKPRYDAFIEIVC